MARKTGKQSASTIAVNKKARFNYFIEERFEAGLALKGWEVKSLRAGKAQLTESYVIVRNGEVWLLGAHLTPLLSMSTHIHADPTRKRKAESLNHTAIPQSKRKLMGAKPANRFIRLAKSPDGH